MEIAVSRIIGVLAGVLIILLGGFVLKAKPGSPLHRLFFAFAVADGLSTAAFSLSLLPSTTAIQLHARLLFYHSFFAFVTLIILFALVFPRQALPARWRAPVVGLVAVAGMGAIVWHALDPHAFWTGRETPQGVAYSTHVAGRVFTSVGYLAVAGVSLRLAHLFRWESSPTHRAQASFVLGGMALGYSPYATNTFLSVFQAGFDQTLGHPEWTVGAVYVSTAIVVAALGYAAFVVLRDRRAEVARERAFVLRCLAGVVLLTIPALLFPGRIASDLLQQIGLLAWPCLLGYAIARYEVFDIGPTVRRTATFSLATTVLAFVFFVAEALLENALQSTFAGALGAPVAAVFIAGGVTALVFAPISALARRIAQRVAPEVVGEARRQRQIEIYRHGLEAVLADGTVSVHENRVLVSLRASLGISTEDHARIVEEIQARGGRRRATAAT